MFMKSFNIISKAILSFCFSINIIVAYSQSNEIKFEKSSFSQIKSKANKENKLIFMDCYTSWCGPCKRMARETFTNDSVVNYFNEHFISCSFDMEKGEGLTLANNYKIGCFPSLLFLDGDGVVIHRGSGYMDVNAFMKFSLDAESSQNSFSKIEKNYKNNPDDPNAAISYIKRLSAACMPYDEVIDKYFSNQKESDLIYESNWELISTFLRSYDNREIQYVINHLDEFRKRYSSGDKFMNPDNFISEVISTTIETYGINPDKTIKDVEDILNVAVKNNIKGFNERSVFKLKMTYYSQQKNWKAYCNLALKDGDRFVFFTNTNEICWNLYLNTNNKNLLEKAVGWMDRYKAFYKKTFDWALSGDLTSTPLNEKDPDIIAAYGESIVYGPWDTYAALLYKLKNKTEAKINAENAIIVGKRFGIDVSETEALLKKIEKL